MSGLERAFAADIDPACQLVDTAAAGRLEQNPANQQLSRPRIRPRRPRTHPDPSHLD